MNCPIKLTIPGNSKFLCVIRGTLSKFLECHQVPESIKGKLILCVDEACSNVIKHSYKGNSYKPIELIFHLDNGVFMVKIMDTGKQCSQKTIKPRDLGKIRPGGLGTHFMFEIMDNVDYCTDRKNGTLLTMTKKLEESADIAVRN